MEIESITWPKKYVERGANVINTPQSVIRILAENNIFKVKETPEQKQQTLDEYLKQQVIAEKP